MARYSDADALIHTDDLPDTSTFQPLGPEFLDWVGERGAEDPEVQRIIALALYERGLISAEDMESGAITLTEDDIVGISVELAVPDPNRAHVAWTPRNRDSSTIITKDLLDLLEPFALNVAALADAGTRLHPEHISLLVMAIKLASSPLATLAGYPTNPMFPEANVVLPEGQDQDDVELTREWVERVVREATEEYGQAREEARAGLLDDDGDAA